MRGRLILPLFSPHPLDISIHAPMRGRLSQGLSVGGQQNFNPRPHAGATCSRFQASVWKRYFNPRPHAGATPPPPKNKKGGKNFNPRPHAGATVRQGSQIPSDVPVFFSRRSVFRFPKPRYPVLFLSVCFPFALTAPWGLQGRKSFWLPGAGFCSDTYCPGCRTAGCRGLCR